MALGGYFDPQLQNISIQKLPSPMTVFRQSTPLVISCTLFAASLGSFSLCLYGGAISGAPLL
jgi:hypothetical protein